MAGPDSFMPIFIADYLGDTRHLSLAQHGAYLLLTFQYWRTGRPLPDDDVILARLCSATVTDWETVTETVRAFFKPALLNGKKVLTHKRIEQELDKAKSNYEKRVAASARANKAKTDAANRLKTKSVTAKVTDTVTATEAAAETVTETVSVTQLTTHNSESEANASENNNNAATSAAVAIEQEIPAAFDRRKKPPPSELPEWVPADTWGDFCDMRSKIRHPMTDAAKALTLRDLSRLREQGHDPRAVLEQSVQRGWRGVFEIGEQNGSRQRANGREKNTATANHLAGIGMLVSEARARNLASGEDDPSGER